MNESAGSLLRYDVDRLIVSGRRLFGWGWLAHRTLAVRSLQLGVDGDGWSRRLPVTHGFPRDDVARAFPDFTDAASAGFVVTGFVPDDARRRYRLYATFEDGSESVIALEGMAESGRERPARPRSLGRLASAVVRRLKTRDFSGLLDAHRERNLPLLDESRIADALIRPLRRAGAVRMIFDHDMGGGANQYRRTVIGRWRASGDAVVLCTYHLPTLDYRFQLLAGEEEATFRASSFVALERVIRDAPVVELFVNSPVSFDDPMLFADWLARMRQAYPAARLTVTLHDYFSVCPSFVLLNDQGCFCGIPSTAECERCLGRHQAAHVALSPPAGITRWREAWGRCLRAADEVRCFSEASRYLLLKAYPGLERTSVVPHVSDYVPSRRPSVDPSAPLVIGTIGTIDVQKGAAIVTDIVRRLDREGAEARVVVLGTLNAARGSRRLLVTGPYERQDLPGLVERHGINMFLFPSIWPETFSYVVSEMMALGLPIVAFDLGAPAERLRDHPLARLVPVVSADAALDAILEFHGKLATRVAHAP